MRWAVAVLGCKVVERWCSVSKAEGVNENAHEAGICRRSEELHGSSVLETVMGGTLYFPSARG